MRKQKTSPMQRIGMQIGFVFVVFCVALFSLYWFLAMHRSWFADEIVYKNDTTYSFFQHPATRWVTISKNGKTQAGFFFYPHVFAAWALESTPYILLVTSDTGTTKGAQGLYLYDGAKTTKVYQSQTVTFASGEKSAGHIYSPWIGDNLQTRKEQMHHVFSFSPEFKYLFGYESGYEGGIGFTVDLAAAERTTLTLTPTDDLQWSPDYMCAISYGYSYGDSQFIERVSYRGNVLESKGLEPIFASSEFRGVYWADSCSGVVDVYSDYDTNGDRHPGHLYYAFSKDSDTMTRLSSFQKDRYAVSVTLPNRLHNIFFTIEKPTAR